MCCVKAISMYKGRRLREKLGRPALPACETETDCGARWGILGVLSVFLPCLVCYAIIKLCCDSSFNYLIKLMAIIWVWQIDCEQSLFANKRSKTKNTLTKSTRLQLNLKLCYNKILNKIKHRGNRSLEARANAYYNNYLENRGAKCKTSERASATVSLTREWWVAMPRATISAGVGLYYI